MTVEYDNELRGVLFRVPENKKTEKGPMYRGECEIQRQKYRISAWIQQSQQGRTYMSLSFTKDEGQHAKKVAKKDSQAPLERGASGAPKREREPGEDEVDSEIPF
jgi:hypothetical protein